MDVVQDQVTIRTIGLPLDVDDPDLRASVDISNAVQEELLGHALLNDSYAEAVRQWQPSRYHEAVRLLADVDGTPAGRAYLGLPLTEDLEKAYLAVVVRAEFRGQGIGTAMLRELERTARENGRTTLVPFATSPAADGPLLPAKTGFGGVAPDAPGTRFLVRHGFELEQAERISQLDLTADREAFERALHRAREASKPDYRVVSWRGRTPEEWIEDVAWMHSRMATDAPSGGIEIDEPVWDADRLRESEERSASDDRYLVTAAAQHIDSGKLVAYSVLSVPVAPGRIAWQEDTLVTREHRGRRLGTLVKAANLLELVAQAPSVPSVFTWNAEENRPMLDVNEALGFRAVGYEGLWQRIDSQGE